MAPKCYHCGELFDEDEDEQWATCLGQATPGVTFANGHRQERKYCNECAEFTETASQEFFLCPDCEALNAPQFSWQAPTADSQDTEKSEEDGELEVARITGSAMDKDCAFGTGDILHFGVEWKNASQVDTDEPFYSAEAEKPEQHFYKYCKNPPADTARAEDEAAGNPFYERLCRGYWALCKPLAEEVFKSPAISGSNPRMRRTLVDLQADIFEILASIPASILASICGAGLRSRKARDEDLYAYLVNNYADSVNRPCIYMLEFTDQIGRAPTLQDMREIVQDARTYSNPQGTDDWKVAVRIDSVGGNCLSTAEKEERRDDDNVRLYLKSKEARVQLDKLLSSLEREMVQLKGDGHKDDQPMLWVLRDVGYTDDCRRRLRAQEGLKSGSNPLMSLFNAIAQSNPTFKAREQAAQAVDKTAVQYRLHGDVIFQCFRWEHAVVAEIMFTILAQSYTWDGRGFNGFQAGISNSSNNKYSVQDWAGFQDMTVDRGVFRRNVDAEKVRVDEVRAKQKKLEDLKKRALCEDLRVLSIAAGLRRELREEFKSAHRDADATED